MSLRGKFQVLLAVFGVSVVANVLVSVWCIGVYMERATRRFHELMSGVQRLALVRSLLDDWAAELKTRGGRPEPAPDARLAALEGQIAEEIARLPLPTDEPDTRRIQQHLASLVTGLPAAGERYLSAVPSVPPDEAARLFEGVLEGPCVAPLRAELTHLTRARSTSITQTSAAVHETETLVTAILSITAVAAFLLAAAGVHFVRRWVLRPLGVLKAAAEHHAAGDLDYRIPRPSADELGRLAAELNRMAECLAASQRRLVEQERMAAVGELASSVAHNIRNPLASIRALAQSSTQELPAEGKLRVNLTRILETVDALNRWVRELLLLHRPIELAVAPLAARTLVDRVVHVSAASAARRGVRLDVEEQDPDCRVRVDAAQAEQVLLAVLDNAVEASPPDSVVGVAIRDLGPEVGRVQLRIIDSGPGMPADILRRIAAPSCSAKPGGTGLGLYLARRIVQAHGGSLDFQTRPEGGTIVVLELPSASTADGLRTPLPAE